MAASGPDDSARPAIPFAEFVVLIGLLMSLTALSVDIMLPALPAIGAALAVADENDRQLVVIVYLLGFGAGQIIVGPFADHYGRKPPLMVGLALCAIACLVCAVAPSFEALLAARVVQGLGLAAPRVVAIAVVRDCFSGRPMARVMSLVMMVFIMVPVIAPTIGEAILLVATWNWIFLFIVTIALTAMVWSALRLEETAQRDRGGAFSARGILRAFVHAATTRQTVGYGLAAGLVIGCILGYIASAQQIFVGIYDLGSLFPLAFAVVSLAMALSSFVNSRLVMRLGMRVVSHGAVIAYFIVSLFLAARLSGGPMSLVGFTAVMWVFAFLFGLTVPNFNAMAMDPQGRIAGTASSLLGSFTTLLGATVGYFVGQAFDGTLLPLALAYAAISGAALIVVVVTERGRLFSRYTGS